MRVATQLPIKFTVGVTESGTTRNYPIPLYFSPTELAGFTEYASTYSEFRILKAVCKVHLALPGDSEAEAVLTNQPYTYLRVASRTFVESEASANTGSDPVSTSNLVRNKFWRDLDELRQSRWQRQYYPSDIKNSISFKFYPYTLEWCGRPYGGQGSGVATSRDSYLKYRSGRRWMPMSFLGATGQAVDDVSFFGPYFARLLSTAGDAAQTYPEFTPVCQLSVWCQFRGQK